MHGGLSPALTERDQLRLIKRGWQDPQGVNIAMDLLWSDPEPGTKGWKSSPRGCSYLFGDDVLSDACRKLDVDVIVRAHQVVQDGYEIHPTQKLFNNAGAAMHVDVMLGCSFSQFWPIDTPQPSSPHKKPTSIATSMPVSSRYVPSTAANKPPSTTYVPSTTANKPPTPIPSSNVGAKPSFHVKPTAPVKLLASSRYTSSAAVPASKPTSSSYATSSRYLLFFFFLTIFIERILDSAYLPRSCSSNNQCRKGRICTMNVCVPEICYSSDQCPTSIFYKVLREYSKS
uniref:protein-serine/threonine phosphatase n=1 Tax=Meloidogyne javanica TaxID=6303 RepID=A0A915LWD7_MELJA